jgi:ferredoxin-NADP reductase
MHATDGSSIIAELERPWHGSGSAGRSAHLHYVAKSPDEVAFNLYLQSLSDLTIYSKKSGNPFDVSKALQLADSNPQIYCCSGEKLIVVG